MGDDRLPARTLPCLARIDSRHNATATCGPDRGGATKPVGLAADVYALGAIIYELLAGCPPIRAATILETVEQVKHAEPVAPSRLQPGLPRDRETICARCVQEAGKRYDSTFAVLVDDLRRYLAGKPVLARRISGTERARRWCRRNPLVSGLFGGIIFGQILAGERSTCQHSPGSDLERSGAKTCPDPRRALWTKFAGPPSRVPDPVDV